MKKKNILNLLKEQAQKTGQKVVKAAKEIADDSGLSTKEGREELLKRTKDIANKTKESIQETALRGASVAKKNVDKSIETIQKKSNQLKEAIKKQKDKKAEANSKEETSKENLLITKPNKTNHSKRSRQNKQNHTATIVGAIAGVTIVATSIVSEFREIEIASSEHCAIYSLEEEYNMMKDCVYKQQFQTPNVIGSCANHIEKHACNEQKKRNPSGFALFTPHKHCAFFSLEQEYRLMTICVNSCGNASKCSERLRQFECSEKNSYEEAKRKANSCSM